jgi:hypothetical protein
MAKRLLLLGCLGLGLAACSASADDSTSSAESSATERVYVTTNSPLLWAPSSYEDFRNISSQMGGGTLPDALPDNDPLTVRLQAWLDRVDAVVRPVVLAKTGAPLAAPRPIAKILISRSTFNAWVTPVAACLGAPYGGSHSPGALPYLGSGSVVPYNGACVHPEGWAAADAVKLWDADKPACALALSNGVLSTKGAGCSVDGNASGGDDIAISSTGRYIQFTTDLLAAVDEKTVAVVAAHELGHYYLGHTTDSGSSKYGFWYTRNDGQAVTPTRAPNSADLEAAYREVVQAGRPLGGPSFSSHYSARLRPLLLSGIAPLLTERTEPDFVCAKARDALGPWQNLIIQGEAPSQDAQKAFLDFESKLAACAPRLALGSGDAKSLSAGATLFAAGANRPGPKVKVAITLGDTLGAFLDRLNVSARGLDQKAAGLVRRLKDNHIGLYTTEQAADESAMDVSTKMGLSTDEILAGWVDFMAAIDRTYAQSFTPEQLAQWRTESAELDAPTCAALMNDGFTQVDATGKRVAVTMNMGQLDEPHHTSCYRLYNLWREARVHHYEIAPAPAPLAPAWADLKAEAATLAASAWQ